MKNRSGLPDLAGQGLSPDCGEMEWGTYIGTLRNQVGAGRLDVVDNEERALN